MNSTYVRQRLPKVNAFLPKRTTAVDMSRCTAWAMHSRKTVCPWHLTPLQLLSGSYKAEPWCPLEFDSRLHRILGCFLGCSAHYLWVRLLCAKGKPSDFHQVGLAAARRFGWSQRTRICRLVCCFPPGLSLPACCQDRFPIAPGLPGSCQAAARSLPWLGLFLFRL
jgi:hypothetical protein